MKIMKKMLDIEGTKNFGTVELTGGWNIKEINEPGVKGYVIEGQFSTGLPQNDVEFVEPFNPARRDLPQRPTRLEEEMTKIQDPFTDVFEDEEAVKIHMELPGQNKKSIHLDIIEGKVEVKTRNFYKVIDIPKDIVKEKASAKYNNGVLTVILPRKKLLSKEKKEKIRIE